MKNVWKRKALIYSFSVSIRKKGLVMSRYQLECITSTFWIGHSIWCIILLFFVQLVQFSKIWYHLFLQIMLTIRKRIWSIYPGQWIITGYEKKFSFSHFYYLTTNHESIKSFFLSHGKLLSYLASSAVITITSSNQNRIFLINT